MNLPLALVLGTLLVDDLEIAIPKQLFSGTIFTIELVESLLLIHKALV